MAKSKKDNEDQPDGNSGNADDSADNFGLPDIEYKPLDRDVTPETAQENVVEPEREQFDSDQPAASRETEDYSYDDDEPRSNAPLFIGLIIGVVILVAGFLIYKYWYVPKGEKEKIERLAKEAEAKRQAEEARLAQEKAEAERKRLEEEAAHAKPATGTIETLTDRTRRYFVVVSSNIDDDLLMDYARKLSAKGVSSKIIPPYGTTKFYRLAISDFDTFSAAQTNADAAKAEYGPALWVIRY
jgi:phosphoglycolate phosphatase-like HAD superfamily hydrolase